MPNLEKVVSNHRSNSRPPVSNSANPVNPRFNPLFAKGSPEDNEDEDKLPLSNNNHMYRK